MENLQLPVAQIDVFESLGNLLEQFHKALDPSAILGESAKRAFYEEEQGTKDGSYLSEPTLNTRHSKKKRPSSPPFPDPDGVDVVGSSPRGRKPTEHKQRETTTVAGSSVEIISDDTNGAAPTGGGPNFNAINKSRAILLAHRNMIKEKQQQQGDSLLSASAASGGGGRSLFIAKMRNQRAKVPTVAPSQPPGIDEATEDEATIPALLPASALTRKRQQAQPVYRRGAVPPLELGGSVDSVYLDDEEEDDGCDDDDDDDLLLIREAKDEKEDRRGGGDAVRSCGLGGESGGGLGVVAAAAAAATAAASSSWALCRHPLQGDEREAPSPPSSTPSSHRNLVIDLSAYGDDDTPSSPSHSDGGQQRRPRDARGRSGGRSGPYDQLLERVAVMTVQMEKMRDEFEKMRTENAILLESLVLAGEDAISSGEMNVLVVEKEAASSDELDDPRFM